MNPAKKVSIYYFFCYVSVIVLLLIGLTFVLASCVPDDYDKRVDQTKGPNVNIAFSVDMSSYTEGGEVTRSSADSPKPITSVVPLDEGLFLEATLVPVPKAPKTRAGEIWLIDSTKVCIAAYDNADAYVKHQLYTVDGDSLRRSQPVFDLPAGTYKFVAYAYHNYYTRPESKTDFDGRTPPGVLSNIEPAADLLYGTKMKTISTDSSYVVIPVIHLFSRIDTIKAVPNPSNSTPDLTAIADVSVKTRKANLTLEATPPLSPGDTLSYTTLNSRWSAIGGTGSWECADTLLAYPGKNTIVEFGTVTVAAGGGSPAKTYHNVSTTFIHELEPSYSYTLQVTLTKYLTIPENNEPLNALTYVGAFWRYNEIGERIIRIAGTGATPTPWTAVVAWWDDRWHPETKDGIVLAPGESPNLAGTAESNQVLGSTTLNGTASASQPIIFRIGLQKPFSAGSGYEPLTPDYTATFPARYAVVLIYYNGLVQKLFLRQGEGPDYLMARGDGSEGGGNVGGENRGAAARFSPYNLTADNLNTVVRATYNAAPDPAEQAAKFTVYPTQAGAFFQWARAGGPSGANMRFAWQAFGSISGWNNVYPSSSYWLGVNSGNLYLNHETCPDKYRRPFDGAVDWYNAAGLVEGSEIRQSLWDNPQSATTDYAKYSAWGYYADGFFDRLQTGTNPSVDVNSATIAHIGRLFYNPEVSSGHYNASLFFPAAGYRNGADGVLTNSGSQGSYHTASSYSADNMWAAYFTSANARMDNANTRNYGYSIRCVYEPPLTGVSLVITGCNCTSGVSGAIGQTENLTATVVPPDAGNTRFEWQMLIGGTWQVITETFENNYNVPIIYVGTNANEYRVRAYNGTGEQYSNSVYITGTFPTGNEELPNMPMYVGAFWRADQKGERVIRIPVGASGLGNSGPWTVSVSWLDAQWGTDRVLLSKSLPSRSILYTANPGNAESYPLTAPNDSTFITGTTAPGGAIEFRIGLDNYYAASSTYPARYAVVLLTYGEGKWRRIFIRQGHDPDYLMEYNAVSRPDAKRFSPYNLIDSLYRRPTNGNNGTPLPVNGGRFAVFPTMVGYMFGWNVNLIAFAPNNGTINAWNQNQVGTGYWSTNPAETCPNGRPLSYGGTANYRRPNDGSTIGPGTGAVNGSEIRQSLWLNPQAGQTSADNADNSVGGYYADGYFDRGPIVTSGTLLDGNTATSYGAGAVTYNPGGISPTPNPIGILIAAAGRLFFNPTTNASLFFPAGGQGAGDNNGLISGVGTMGTYWTSTAYSMVTGGGGNNSNSQASYFYFNSDANANSSVVRMDIVGRAYMNSVRCVQD